jgi:hypothetical protein
MADMNTLRPFPDDKGSRRKVALSVNESNRVAQYESVKEKVQQDVNTEVANHADRIDENERARAAAVGGQLKRKALNELVNTEAEQRVKVAGEEKGGKRPLPF